MWETWFGKKQRKEEKIAASSAEGGIKSAARSLPAPVNAAERRRLAHGLPSLAPEWRMAAASPNNIDATMWRGLHTSNICMYSGGIISSRYIRCFEICMQWTSICMSPCENFK